MKQSEFTALAARYKKPKKADIRQSLITIAAGIEDNQTLDTLAGIFAYFMESSTTKKPKTAFDWVALATGSDKDVRVYLRGVMVSDDHTVATDGHRLHLVPRERNTGYYLRTGEESDLDGQTYPTYTRVIPPKKDRDLIKTTKQALLAGRRDQLGRTDVLEIAPDVWATFSYLKDALAVVGETAPVDLYHGGPADSVLLEYPGKPGYLSVIMPIRK